MPEMGHTTSKQGPTALVAPPPSVSISDAAATLMGTAACPHADLGAAKPASESGAGCPFALHSLEPFNAKTISVTEPVPLAVSFGTHRVSRGSAALLADVGGGDRIWDICTRFYERMHEDSHLKQFLFLDDGPVQHGKRLADWIVEKMGGEGKPWTESGRFGMRQPSHHAAWNSLRRHPSVRGDHFNLQDTRVWMRLHFWAVRETGLHQHPQFWSWYQAFIGHFIAVYERRAPPYTAESAEWSSKKENLEKYVANGNTMPDLEYLGRR